MVKERKEVVKEGQGVSERDEEKTPRVHQFSQKGIKTSRDFANFMSSLMSDLVEGRVSPNVGNATCNAGGKLLKVIDMEYKYGTKQGESKKTLTLAIGIDDEPTKQNE